MKLLERFRKIVGSLARPRRDLEDGDWKFEPDAQTLALQKTKQAQFDKIAQMLNMLIPAESRIGNRNFHAVVVATDTFGTPTVDINLGLWNDAEYKAAQFCLHADGSMNLAKIIEPQTGISHAQVCERSFNYFLSAHDIDEHGNWRHVAVIPRRPGDPYSTTEDVMEREGHGYNNKTYNHQGHDDSAIIYRGIFDTFDLYDMSRGKIKTAQALQTVLTGVSPSAQTPAPVQTPK